MMKQMICFLAILFSLNHPGITATPQSSDSSQALEKIEILKSRHTRIRIFPYAFYTPETSLAFGLGGIVTFYTSESVALRPSKLSLSAYYSTNRQYEFALTPQVYLLSNQLFLSTDLILGYNVERFYGIGNDTPDAGTEEYTANTRGAMFNLQFPPLIFIKASRSKTGFLYDYQHYAIKDYLDNPYLLSMKIPGQQGGILSGAGFIWSWDNRNSIFYPTSGGYHQVTALFYSKELGSDYNFNRYKVDIRQYFTLEASHIVAVQLYASFIPQDAPFYALSKLGGQQIMRGYYEGRFRDKNLMAGQVEYRSPFWRRLGFVAFAGLGEVSNKISRFEMRTVKYSMGIGLRFLLAPEEKVNLRADLGIGKHTRGIYFGVEEAF